MTKIKNYISSVEFIIILILGWIIFFPILFILLDGEVWFKWILFIITYLAYNIGAYLGFNHTTT